MSLSKSALPPATPVDAETTQLANAAWARWHARCCWFLKKPDFKVAGEVQRIIDELRRNGPLAAWNDANALAERIA